jgi:hypothetical protein
MQVNVSPKWDIFGLGVLLACLLTFHAFGQTGKLRTVTVGVGTAQGNMGHAG